MKTDDFINSTLIMPSFQKVFSHEKKMDYIILRPDFVRNFGIQEVTWCLGRLNEILQTIGVTMFLENSGAWGYKLVAKERDNCGKPFAVISATTES